MKLFSMKLTKAESFIISSIRVSSYESNMHIVPLKDMYETDRAFSKEACKRLDEQEKFIYFLKRYNFLVELNPLHSKARAHTSGKRIY